MENKLKTHKVRIIPNIEEKTVDGKSQKVVTYERTSNPSEKARAAGYTADKFFHLELTEESTFKLGGAPKPFTMSVFKTTHPVLFSAIAQEIEDKAFTELATDNIIVLTEKLPGRIVERETPAYFGTEPTADGGLKVRQVRTKQKDGSFLNEPMVNNSLKFFLFENEANDDAAEEVAFQREFRRRKLWLVKNNSDDTEDDDAPDAQPETKSEPEADAAPKKEPEAAAQPE